jgi:hypothetical protein
LLRLILNRCFPGVVEARDELEEDECFFVVQVERDSGHDLRVPQQGLSSERRGLGRARPSLGPSLTPSRTTKARSQSELSEYRHGDSNADESDGKPVD